MFKRIKLPDKKTSGWIYKVRDNEWKDNTVIKIGKIKINKDSNDITDDITKRYHTYYINLNILSVNEFENYDNCEKLIHNLLESFRHNSSEIFIGLHPKLSDIIIRSVGEILENEDTEIYIKRKAGQKRKRMDTSDQPSKKDDSSVKVPPELWEKIFYKMITKLKHQFNIDSTSDFTSDYNYVICELNKFLFENKL